VVSAGLLLAAGCGSPEARTEKTLDERTVETRHDSKLTLQELDQLTYAYADRHGMVLNSAIDQIKQNYLDPVQRRIAHRIKVNGVLAMNDIVSGNDPYLEPVPEPHFFKIHLPARNA